MGTSHFTMCHFTITLQISLTKLLAIRKMYLYQLELNSELLLVVRPCLHWINQSAFNRFPISSRPVEVCRFRAVRELPNCFSTVKAAFGGNQCAFLYFI